MFQAQLSALSGEAERRGGHGRLQRQLALWNSMVLQGFRETKDVWQPADEVGSWLQLSTSLQCPWPVACLAPVQNGTCPGEMEWLFIRCYPCNWHDPNHTRSQAQRGWCNWKPAHGSVFHCGVHTSPAKSRSRKEVAESRWKKGWCCPCCLRAPSCSLPRRTAAVEGMALRWGRAGVMDLLSPCKSGPWTPPLMDHPPHPTPRLPSPAAVCSPQTHSRGALSFHLLARAKSSAREP